MTYGDSTFCVITLAEYSESAMNFVMQDFSEPIVERTTHLSDSFIWNLQSKYYEKLGIEAWLSGVVPSRVTCNTYIAQEYARLIATYAADVQAERITIVELGAGHGRFGFLCATHLKEMAQRGTFVSKQWSYLLTDVANSNIDFWQKHEAFQPLIDEGCVDFARFEAGKDTSLVTKVTGACIDTSRPTEHLVIIANYFFDSLPLDVWKVNDGKLSSCAPVFKLQKTATCNDPGNIEILGQLELDWELEEKTAADYADVRLNGIVDGLAKSIDTGAFTIPRGAFQTIEQLNSWSSNGCLLLVSDKGYSREADLAGRPLPKMEKHGCFSFSLNFCALQRWFIEHGGMSLVPTYRHELVSTSAFATRSAESLPRLRYEYLERSGSFTPDDYHQLTRRLDEASPDMRACLSALRLSGCEPQMLYRLRRNIRSNLKDCGSYDRNDLRELLPRVMQNFFHLDELDVPFAVGLIYQRMGDFDLAVAHYNESIRYFGAKVITLTNMASCLKELNQLDESKELLDRALAMSPDDIEAVALRQQLNLDLSTP